MGWWGQAALGWNSSINQPDAAIAHTAVALLRSAECCVLAGAVHFRPWTRFGWAKIKNACDKSYL